MPATGEAACRKHQPWYAQQMTRPCSLSCCMYWVNQYDVQDITTCFITMQTVVTRCADCST
jgi:hypothetical protein